MHVLLITSKQTHSRSFTEALKRLNIATQTSSPKMLQEWASHQSDLCFIPSLLSHEEWIKLLPWIKTLPKHVPLLVYGSAPEGLSAWSKELGQCIILNETLSTEQTAKLIKEIIHAQHERKPTSITESFLNFETRTLETREQNIRLTRKEFFLLELLTKNAGHITSRERIIDYVWDKHHYVAPNTIEVYVSRLRKKLQNLEQKMCISTIPCLGYSLEWNRTLQSV
jgi:DNA-binding response OmpR family regulator